MPQTEELYLTSLVTNDQRPGVYVVRTRHVKDPLGLVEKSEPVTAASSECGNRVKLEKAPLSDFGNENRYVPLL